MRRSLCLALAAGACVVLVIDSTRLRADDPVSSNVRFNREIIRILQRRCLPCHSSGGLDISLATYRDVRDWSRAIREEVVEQRMPPSIAAPGFGRFQNPLSLTARETSTLLAWLDGGMPRGDEKDLPPPFDPAANEKRLPPHADVRVPLPPQDVPALEELVVRRVTVDPHLASDRLVSTIVVRPGSRATLRGALVYQDTANGHWLAAWLPWQQAFPAPPRRAFNLSKGASLAVVLYYRGGDKATVDRSALDIYFAPQGSQPLESLRLQTSGEGSAQLVLSEATTIWAIQPSLASTTESLEVRARRPDGSIDVLLWAPRARPEWPAVLALEEPMAFPPKTVLTVSSRPRDGSAPQPDRVTLSGWRATPRRP